MTLRKPDFLLVGAPRCATTAMFAYLSGHPDIYFPLRKEVHYFGSDLDRRDGNPWFVTDEARYLSLFEAASSEQIVGEASVLYLYSKTAAAEIAEFNPNTKIIIQLRNPIDMLYSYHGQHLLSVQEDISDFEQAYRAVPARRRGEQMPPWCIMPQQLLYPDIGRFSEQIKRYQAHFPAEQIHIMLYDDFRRDSAATFASLLEFLGVDTSFEPDFVPINSHRQVRCARLQGETQVPSWPTRVGLSLLPDRYQYLSLIYLAILNSKPAKRKPLRAEFKRELVNEFSDEISQLGQLLGRDLSAWLQGEQVK